MIKDLFLSVGAMKAGTTWLYEQLKDHPQIYFTPEKEIHYFANKVGIEDQLSKHQRVGKLKSVMGEYAKGNLKYIAMNVDRIYWYANFSRANEINNEWYESLFSLAVDAKYCADFSNLYCQMGEEGWENVKAVSTNQKVIYTLRDPIERAWSHYKFHMKWVNREDEVLELGFDYFKDLIHRSWFWNNGKYAENYRNLKQSINENSLMLLYFEDFRDDPKKMLEQVQSFLEIQQIPASEERLGKQVNKTKDYKIPDQWLDHLVAELRVLVKEMKEEGIWHSSWRDIY